MQKLKTNKRFAFMCFMDGAFRKSFVLFVTCTHTGALTDFEKLVKQ